MPKENDWIIENTEKLRESEETVLIKKNESQEVHSKPALTSEKKETDFENKLEKDAKKHENNEKKIDTQENITNHFQNLNQALNDFFSSEEGEESEENSEA